MFYSKAALNTRGQVQFGLRHIRKCCNFGLITSINYLIDILNRSPFQQIDEGDTEARTRLTRQNDIHTLRVMMYMFPRQFGLHNVFTSKVDPKETSQRLKDYTLREDEIFEKFGRLADNHMHLKTPKRLRGNARDLVRRLQVLHQRCSYSQLLQYYCPVCLSKYPISAITNTNRSVYLRMNPRFNQNLIRFINGYRNHRTGKGRIRHSFRDRCGYYKEARIPQSRKWRPRLPRCRPSARLFLRK